MAWYDTSLGAHYTYTGTEAKANAWEVYNYFRGLGTPWAIESIAALCGNMSVESYLNPYIRESTQSGAFGLVQWITHKRDMINWAEGRGLRATSGPAQVQYIEQERLGIDDQWLQRGEYAQSFSSFAYNWNNLSVSQLARCFWDCFERSAEYQTARATRGEYYYTMFTGEDPPGPGPGPEPGEVPAWLLLRKKKPWWKMGGRKYITT